MSASDVICDAEDSISTSHHTNISNNIVRIGILKDIQLYKKHCEKLDSFLPHYNDRRKFHIIYADMKLKRGKKKNNLVPLYLLLETKFKVNDQQYLRHSCKNQNRILGRVQNNNVRIYIYIYIAFYNSFLLFVCKLYVSIHYCRSNNDIEIDFIKNCDAFGKSVFKSSDNAVCNCGPACRFKSDTNVQNNCGLLPDAVPDAEELLDVDLIRLLNKVIYICIYMIPYNNHNI